MYDPGNRLSLEKYSSAVTLSDMEIFVFPELMFALVLANIASPLPWQWRADSWFRNIDRMSPYRRIMRVKQFLMDRFSFNLDLDTWGLTTRERELERFAGCVDEQVLARSNALFGYEGDRYYFDMDIRRHFGLDKYTDNVIPYWKTETVEAMSAFQFKQGYPGGAGECVSLAALYAAALYVIAGVPLNDIYLMATPLHSQNFIDVRDGMLTNNRRVVTRKMFFNGTELSDKARRALENEHVTLVVHNTGYVHTLYGEATMAPAAYQHFRGRLKAFLKTNVTFEVLASFLRQNRSLQERFQVAHRCCGKPRFIEAEKLFHYEHSSSMRIGDDTQVKLLHEIDEDEFYPDPLPGRVLLEQVEAFFQDNDVSVDNPGDIERLKTGLGQQYFDVEAVVRDLLHFCRVEPRLPAGEKQWVAGETILPDVLDSREAVLQHLSDRRLRSETIDLAFVAYRDMARAPWKPFLKAALERNPVCVENSRQLSIDEVAGLLSAMPGESIYDGTRMAQPDEVWNFGRGDGLEKALCLMTVINARTPGAGATLRGAGSAIELYHEGRTWRFTTAKALQVPAADDFRF